MPSVQLQSNATGNGWLCWVNLDGNSWVFQGQLFQNEHPISRSQADAYALVFFIGKCVDQSLSNCLTSFIYAARKLINHLIAEKMLVYRHASFFHTVLAWINFFNNRGDKHVDVASDFTCYYLRMQSTRWCTKFLQKQCSSVVVYLFFTQCVHESISQHLSWLVHVSSVIFVEHHATYLACDTVVYFIATCCSR